MADNQNKGEEQSSAGQKKNYGGRKYYYRKRYYKNQNKDNYQKSSELKLEFKKVSIVVPLLNGFVKKIYRLLITSKYFSIDNCTFLIQ